MSPAVYNRYLRATCLFLAWVLSCGLALAGDMDELDQHVCWYVEHLWLHGEGRNLFGDTLSGNSYFLRRKRILQGGWNLYSTWSRLEIPNRAPPFSAELLWAFCGVALHFHRVDWCGLPAVGFHCILRTEEFMGARTHQFSIDGSGLGAIALPWTKSSARHGAQEVYSIDDPFVGRLVLQLLAALPAGALLLQGSAVEFRQFFIRAAHVLHVSGVGYRPYSVRRGGATHDFLSNRSLGKIVVRGRWSDARTARIYINDGLAILTQLNLGGQAREAIAHFGQLFLQYVLQL